jgi:hypothetical protein
MLFYAFDVLYEMYVEQGDVAEKYIPQEILKHNLYGIDIDPGAAQLAALSLYVKAKSEEPDVEIEQINIVSADAVLVNGEKKEEVLARTETELEERVLEQVWQSFEHIREWGSLVRIEKHIEEIIEEEIEEIRATGQTQFTEDGLAKQSSVVSFSGEEESWQQVQERLLSQVSELAEEALEQNDPIEEMFVGEVGKSVRLLDLFLEDYDVTITNPPYLGSGKMGANLKNFVKDNYRGSTDLYTSFIERCGEFSKNEGYVSMITMETFMFLYSYRGLRADLLENFRFTEALHIRNRDEGYLNVAFTFVNQSPENTDNRIRFNRLVNETDKRSSAKSLIQTLRDGGMHPEAYIANQDSFLNIGRQPLLYIFGEEILNLYTRLETLDTAAEIKTGLQTGDNEEFQRRWWEVPDEWVGTKYRWINQSGDDNLFYDSTEWLIEWEKEGERVKSHPKSSARNEDYYYKEGINFRNFSKQFTARYQKESEIFGDTAYFIQPNNHEIDELLAYLSSSLAQFILDGLNPGLNFEVGDVKRLPIKQSHENSEQMTNLAGKAIERRQFEFSLKETKREFDGKAFLDNFDSYLYKSDLIKSDIKILQSMISDIIFREYNISDDIKKKIQKEYFSGYHKLPHLKNTEESEFRSPEYRQDVPLQDLNAEEYQEVVEYITNSETSDVLSLSTELDISPYTVAMIRHEHDLYTRDEKREAAGRLLSYYIGCTMGRWEFEHLDPDDNGIIVFDNDFDDNVMGYLRRCIELTYGEDELYEKETKIEEMLNKSIKDWLRNTFFRYHHCKQYRRRGQRIPIYWQLESDEGAFSCFVYYHKMDADTLHKLRGQYIDKKLDTLQNRLEAIESELEAADGDLARDLRAEKEEIQADIDDITEFRNRVDALIEEGFEPDFEAGIWENIQKVDEHNLLAVPLDKL